MGAETVLPTNIANGNSGHAAKHNATNTQVNYLTTALAAAEGVDLAEDLGPFEAGKGILLTSPDGETVVRLRIDNDGELVTEDATEGGGGDGAPGDVANLLAWFKASDLSALSNGAAVNSWPDAVGSNDMLGGDPYTVAPLYATAGINSHPAVHFVAASSQRMKFPEVLASQKPFTLFLALKVSNFTTGHYLLSGGGGIEVAVEETSGTVRFNKGDTASILGSSSPLTVDTGAVLCVRYDGSGAAAIFINGTAAGTATNDQTLSSAASLLGKDLDGYIGEVLIYSTALSPTDRGTVEDYLAGAWGTP